MRIPPIEPVDPTIHMPSQPDTVGDRCNLSENVIMESNTISMISQAPSRTASTRCEAGYCLSTSSRKSATNLSCSGYRRHRGGDTIDSIDNQSRHDSLLCPTACTPTNVKTEFPTQPPPKPKRRSKVHLISFPTLKRIRRLLASSGDQPLLTQKAVWIAPAQCAETVVVASTGHQNRPTNHSSSRREDMITASEDGARGCCSFFG
ncbi:hypothetical protein EDD16DRAFT_1669301 [Pisolithus croceorrhizus]|nr:hypothetical protein EDD16DRAFT_1669301 [Pisolithus croceorrhizus]KAI6105989.1 hypothetical protein EV401DRAFT_595087 [Pisolithus croceorrhizus]